MNLLITSGATSEPIDNVRTLTNLSSGTTGCKIAEEALIRGHKVFFIHSKNSKIPFLHNVLSYAYKKPNLIEESKKYIELYNKYKENLILIPITYYTEYFNQTIKLLSDNKDINIGIFSMAASDFKVTNKVKGKMDCVNTIKLTNNIKLIDNINTICPKLFTISFKLLSTESSSYEDLIEKAYSNLLKHKAKLTIANLVNKDFKPIKTCIISLEKNVTTIERHELESKLLDTIEEKYTQHYFKTIPYSEVNTMDNTFPKEDSPNLNKLVGLTQQLSDLHVFPTYLKSDSRQFGFVSMRSTIKNNEQRFYITQRGSTKTNISVNSFSLSETNAVAGVTHYKGTSKPTLNAPLAAQLYNLYPNCNYIFHVHFFFNNHYTTKKSSIPGSDKDLEHLNGLPSNIDLSSTAFCYNQKEHGSYILCSNQEQFLKFLQDNQTYKVSGQLYENLYERFLNNTKILNLSELNNTCKYNILDYRGGTGYLTKLITKKCPFSKVYLYEENKNMPLNIPPSIKVFSSQEELPKDHFNRIILRQCINYDTPSNWKLLFSNLASTLTKNGIIIANTFSSLSQEKTYKTYTFPDKLTHEASLLSFDKTTIYHTQTNTHTSDPIIDFNIFYNTPSDITTLLKQIENHINQNNTKFKVITSLIQEQNSLYLLIKRIT